MSRDAYELLALGARYVFAGLMVLIALRAARLTAVDSRRAAKLRRLSPMTGLSGELVVLEGDGKAPRGMRYPVIREGMIGSARSCDVRIRHASVRRRHACFQLTEQGLSVRDHAGARLRDGDGEVVREMTLLDGDSFWVGRIHLLLVLSNATAAQSRRAPEDLFATRREEDWDGEGRETLGEAAAYDGEGRGARDEAAAYDGEDWDARGEARNFARVEAHSREDFDEERDWYDNAPRNSAFDGVNSCAASLRTPRRADTRRREDRRDGAPYSRGPSSARGASDDSDRAFSVHPDLRSRADSPARPANAPDMRRREDRGDGAPYSHGLSSSRGASDDSDRAFSVHSDLRSRDTRAEASPLPGITRDAAPRGDARFSAEPSISREDRRSHAFAPRGGMKRSSQPRVREGVRREPEPPDDLFMDDL